MPHSEPICVIFNPLAGRGRAKKLIHAMRQDAGREVKLRPTSHPGHAVELARDAALEGFASIIAAGGDGTVHEVANGILMANRPETTLGVWPIGSANDYAHALGIQKSSRSHAELGVVRAVDVGCVNGGGRSCYFVNCMGAGFNGAVTLEARRIRWLRGMPLYGLATLKAVMKHFEQPVLCIQFDELIREIPTLALSVNLGPREGNLPVTPNAKLDDGWFDAVHAGPLTRWQALKLLPRLATGTLPSNNPLVWTGRCRRVQVGSPAPLRVHVDGEFFCQPADGIRELSIEILPSRLRVFTVDV